MKVSDVLQVKGSHVYSINSQASVYEAIKEMAEKNIGALIVIDNEELTGILSERDYARKIVLKGKSSHEILVKEIMTKHVKTVTPDDTIEHCMELMSDNHFRHLPILKDNGIMGMISIGDVVNAIIESQKETIAQLHQYIAQ